VAVDPESPSRIELAMLSAMNGQDMRMLDAVVACWHVYAYADNAGRRGALVAVSSLLTAMSHTARFIARELIPYALDWSYRDTVWAALDKVDQSAPKQIAAQIRALQFARNLSCEEIDRVIDDVRGERVKL
jgi:hypothetical protein